MTCPFDGDNFSNFKCLKCGYKPSDLNYIADGITCPRCINTPNKEMAIAGFFDFVDLNDTPESIIAYSAEIEKYIKE